MSGVGCTQYSLVGAVLWRHLAPQEAEVVLRRHVQHKLVRVLHRRLCHAGSCGVIDGALVGCSVFRLARLIS